MGERKEKGGKGERTNNESRKKDRTLKEGNKEGRKDFERRKEGRTLKEERTLKERRRELPRKKEGRIYKKVKKGQEGKEGLLIQEDDREVEGEGKRKEYYRKGEIRKNLINGEDERGEGR